MAVQDKNARRTDKSSDVHPRGMNARPRLGAVETGGTKIVCAVGDIDGNITERMTMPTDVPDVSVPKVIA